jgi:hypothetical protein
MERMIFALAAKWASIWVVLLFLGLIGGPALDQAAVMAAVTALISYGGDRLIPFSLQGITRWAIDAGLATLVIYLSQWLWPGPGLNLFMAILAGMVIGAIEIPLHFLLASRYGVRKRDDNRDGIH